MGKMHKSRFKPGQVINNAFTLIENYSQKTTIKGKNQWMWKCICKCGNEFVCRENQVLNRKGCHSCTNKITSTETALKKKGGIKHIGLKNRLLKDYRTGAVKRGKVFELTFDQFINLVEQNCYYCGAKPIVHEYEKQYMQQILEPWAHNGIDRKDSSKGYIIDNCVPCCSFCNYAKHEMTEEEFKNYISKVYTNLILKGSSTIPKGSTSKAIVDGNGTHLEKDEDIVKSV